MSGQPIASLQVPFLILYSRNFNNLKKKEMKKKQILNI